MSELGQGAEFDAIRRMLARWGARASGIGDDAAVVPPYVISVDSSIEGRHFRKEWMSPREIGYRATAAALSDLAAMGATPVGVLPALGVPTAWRKALDDVADGIGEAAEAAGAKILGGNLTAAGELSLTITVIGSAAAPLTRTGARPGQSVYVTGALGGSGAALRALMAGRTPPAEYRDRFVHPVPRIREGLWLQAHGARAAIDISDGLAADLGHLAAASKVRIEIDLLAVPVMEGVDPLDAIASGEEYELIATAERLDTSDFTKIGRVVSGAPEVMLLREGERVAVPRGHDHFSSE